MDSESDSKVEPEEQEKKSNAFLIGLALNLGRAARTAVNGLEAISATASKVGAGFTGQAPKPNVSADAEGSETTSEQGGEESQGKKKDKKKKE